ncbi:MAG: NUDIX domain-containing protein [Acetobacteraceae bacterium]|nr:NUDIX domain-containing protein [Acetobacteraceae bacterium]
MAAPPASLPRHPHVEIESEQRVWNGLFPLDVVQFRHRRFDGRMSALRTWELWRRGRAAALLPYDPDADLIVVMEQFRLPALAAGIEPVLLEFPAGLCEPGEDPLTTIVRESEEEIRLQPDRLERIGDFMLTPGGADEYVALYAGRVRAPETDRVGIAGHGGTASESEDIRVRVLPATEAIERALAGSVTNSVTALGLLWLASRRDWLRGLWSRA